MNAQCGLPTGSVFGDINHDGLVDEIGSGDASGSGTRISTRDPSTGRVLPFSSLLPQSFHDDQSEAHGLDALIDMDGDGLADYLIPDQVCQHGGGNTFSCTAFYFPGDGRGFRFWRTTLGIGLPLSVAITPFPSTPGVVTRIHDLNGDGLADMIIVGEREIAVSYNVDGQHWLYLETGASSKMTFKADHLQR